MGLSTVKQFLRSVRDSLQVPEVQVAPTSEDIPVTAEHYAPPGIDAVPLEGDTAVQVAGAGNGRKAVVGYMDTVNAGVAEAGEVRIYSRNGDKEVVAYAWLKSGGEVVIRAGSSGGTITLKPEGNVVINGVTIDTDGNVITPGDVTVKEGASQVTVSTHLHPTAMGPSGAPTPGT